MKIIEIALIQMDLIYPIWMSILTTINLKKGYLGF
jgi:hypothetical protein